MNPVPFLWLAAVVGFLLLEASTFSMTSVWFAVGAAAALLTCLFTGSFRVQALVFIVVSALCLLMFRPLAAKLRQKSIPTNGDRNLGREATVLTTVTADLPGRVRLDGVDWSARTAGAPLAPGTLCRVVALDSAVLIVAPETGDPAQPPVETMV